MEVKTWTSEEPLPEQMRWKISKREEKQYFEIESNSLRAIVWLLFVLWKRNLKRILKTMVKQEE